MAERVRVRDITSEEGNRLLRILRRGTGSVVTWRQAQMILLSAQGMPVPRIAEVTSTSPDRVQTSPRGHPPRGLWADCEMIAAAEASRREGWR